MRERGQEGRVRTKEGGKMGSSCRVEEQFWFGKEDSSRTRRLFWLEEERGKIERRDFWV